MANKRKKTPHINELLYDKYNSLVSKLYALGGPAWTRSSYGNYGESDAAPDFQDAALNQTAELYGAGAASTLAYSQDLAASKASSFSGVANKAMGVASGAMQVIGAGILNSKIKDTSALEAAIKKANSTDYSALNSNQDVLNAWGSYKPQEMTNWKDLLSSKGQAAANTIGGMASGASAGMAFGPWGAVAGAAIGLFSGLFGRAAAKRKAKKRAAYLNLIALLSNNRNMTLLLTSADQADTNNDNLIALNFSAYGGPINSIESDDFYNNTVNGSIFANGGSINIDPANRGKFNATKRRTGKTTEELTHSKNPLTRKRAIFALNAAKWHHADGGPLNPYGNLFDDGGDVNIPFSTDYATGNPLIQGNPFTLDYNGNIYVPATGLYGNTLLKEQEVSPLSNGTISSNRGDAVVSWLKTGAPAYYTDSKGDIQLYKPSKEVKELVASVNSMNQSLDNWQRGLTEVGYNLPVVGDAMSGIDAINAGLKGNYGEAALLGTGLLLPNFLEGAGRGIARLGKKASKYWNADKRAMKLQLELNDWAITLSNMASTADTYLGYFDRGFKTPDNQLLEAMQISPEYRSKIVQAKSVLNQKLKDLPEEVRKEFPDLNLLTPTLRESFIKQHPDTRLLILTLIDSSKNYRPPVIKMRDLRTGKLIESPIRLLLEDQVRKNIEYVLELIPGSIPSGSALSFLEGNPKIPGDIDVHKALDYGELLEGASPVAGRVDPETGEVLTYRKNINSGIGDDGQIDINIYRNNKNGTLQLDDNSLEALRLVMPLEYERIMKEAVDKKMNPKELRLIQTKVTALQLLDAEDKVKDIKAMADSFESNKSKADARPFSFITYADPLKVDKALDMLLTSHVGTQAIPYKGFTRELLSNTRENYKLLKKLGFKENVYTIANDPDRMLNALKYAYINNTILSRRVKPNGDTPIEEMMHNWKVEGNDKAAGNYGGAGLNTVLFGDSLFQHTRKTFEDHKGTTVDYGNYIIGFNQMPVDQGKTPREFVDNLLNASNLKDNKKTKLFLRNYKSSTDYEAAISSRSEQDSKTALLVYHEGTGNYSIPGTSGPDSMYGTGLYRSATTSLDGLPTGYHFNSPELYWQAFLGKHYTLRSLNTRLNQETNLFNSIFNQPEIEKINGSYPIGIEDPSTPYIQKWNDLVEKRLNAVRNSNIFEGLKEPALEVKERMTTGSTINKDRSLRVLDIAHKAIKNKINTKEKAAYSMIGAVPIGAISGITAYLMHKGKLQKADRDLLRQQGSKEYQELWQQLNNLVLRLDNDPTISKEEKNNRIDLILDQLNNLDEKELMRIKGNHKAFGGELGTNSADFTSGLTEINEGGTHELNPNQGVLMGTDQEGTPNLVEEGETVFNDYVFSNRIKVPDDIAASMKLQKGLTYAEASKKLNEEHVERPNDPISLNGQLALLLQLAMAQEIQRLELLLKLANKHAFGGNLFKNAGQMETKNKIKPTSGNVNSYNYWSNTGLTKDEPLADRVKPGWKAFVDYQGNPLYDEKTGMYADKYVSPAFINYIKLHPGWAMNWFTKQNAPAYFAAGNTAAPTMEQLIGTVLHPGLMFDKQYSDAHRYGEWIYDRWLKSLLPKEEQPVVTGKAWTPKPLPTRMRYAPVVGSALNVIAGLGSKPDYSNADLIAGVNTSPALVGAEHIGNYLLYNPFDTEFYINKLLLNNAATRRAIINNSNANRGMANASLLANDYNVNNNIGELARLAAESNFALKTQVEGFNRATNQYNADNDMKSGLANLAAINQSRALTLDKMARVAAMRELARNAHDSVFGTNLTNFFNNLGNIGWENFNMNMVNSNRALRYGVHTNGISEYKGSSTSNEATGTTTKKSKGGRINRRRTLL